MVLILGIDSVAQYAWGFPKRQLLYADQHSYIYDFIRIIAISVNVVATVILIHLGCEIHIVKLVSAVVFVLQPYGINWYATKHYKLIKKMSQVEQIEHFTGSGLYDKEFVQVLRDLKDPKPFLRGIVAELGFERKEIPYEQPQRRAGKTSNNFYRLYDAAMLSITSYTKVGLRIATIGGAILSGLSLVAAFVYLILKLCMWDEFPAGMAPVVIGMFVLGSVQLFFIGLLGEYILNINDRVMNRPLVVEAERINFDEEEKK